MSAQASPRPWRVTVERVGSWFRWVSVAYSSEGKDLVSAPTFTSKAAAFDAAIDEGYQRGFCRPVGSIETGYTMQEAT